MELDDAVIVINRADPFYGYKFTICGILTAAGKITGYAVHDGYGRHRREYAATDVQYTTPTRRTFTGQMQLL
jgi:hypothetical protein